MGGCVYARPPFIFVKKSTMTSSIIYLGELRTESTHLASGETVITDAPTDNHGKGQAFSPTDMVANNLATCMITVMGIFAQNSNISMEGTHAKVKKTMASDPRRISQIDIEIYLPKSIEERHRAKIESVGRNCPVAMSLHPDLVQNVRFIYA